MPDFQGFPMFLFSCFFQLLTAIPSKPLDEAPSLCHGRVRIRRDTRGVFGGFQHGGRRLEPWQMVMACVFSGSHEVKHGKPNLIDHLKVTVDRPKYPLVNIQKAIENGHRNSEFSH